ncbi:MAG: hypothetical protein H6R25_1194 [Proteobacteria bacterium]|nr:hypothetical protein [Pseudomonadota bacterium]
MLIKLSGTNNDLVDRYEIISLIRTLKKERCVVCINGIDNLPGSLYKVGNDFVDIEINFTPSFSSGELITISLYGECCKMDFMTTDWQYNGRFLSILSPVTCTITQRRKNKRFQVPESLHYSGSGVLNDGHFINFDVMDLSSNGIGLCVDKLFVGLIKNDHVIKRVNFKFNTDEGFFCDLKVLNITSNICFRNCSFDKVKLSCLFLNLGTKATEIIDSTLLNLIIEERVRFRRILR